MSELKGTSGSCYQCVHRGNVPGSAHSKCNHPAADPLKPEELNITANYHGIRRGWFVWPFDFDPVWLGNCDGFTERT